MNTEFPQVIFEQFLLMFVWHENKHCQREFSIHFWDIPMGKLVLLFPLGLVKPLKLVSLPHQKNKKLQNKLPRYHLKGFNERIQNYALLTKPACCSLFIYCSARSANSTVLAPKSPSINMQWLADTFKGNKKSKSLFNNAMETGKWRENK